MLSLKEQFVSMKTMQSRIISLPEKYYFTYVYKNLLDIKTSNGGRGLLGSQNNVANTKTLISKVEHLPFNFTVFHKEVFNCLIAHLEVFHSLLIA